MKKPYLAEIFNEKDFKKWIQKKKVLLNFPTGRGKTTLIMDKFIPFCRTQKKKCLILSNRRLLNEQYSFDLAERYESLKEQQDDVMLMTYHTLVQVLMTRGELKNFLNQFDVVIVDESHFFYSDSDFNGFGTYVLLQELIYSCFFKTMVFMTATAKEVRKILYEVFDKVEKRHKYENKGRITTEGYKLSDYDYDYEDDMDYTHISPVFVEDVESLAYYLANSSGKSIVFIDDKKRAEEFKKILIEIEKTLDDNIVLLNSELLEKDIKNPITRELVLKNQFESKILLTTSVLDNGVSVHDSKIENIVIATESRISFLQMLGRIRTEMVSECKLFIFPRKPSYYECRVEQYQEKLKQIQEIRRGINEGDLRMLLLTEWNNLVTGQEYSRELLIITLEKWETLSRFQGQVQICGREILMCVNLFALAKIGDMFLAEKNFLRLRYQSPVKVAEHQLSWIHKKPEDLCVIGSTYIEQLTNELIESLLQIRDYDLNAFSGKKVEIAEKYRKLLFPDLAFKGDSFGNDKFADLCKRFGCELHIRKDSNRKNLYTVNSFVNSGEEAHADAE